MRCLEVLAAFMTCHISEGGNLLRHQSAVQNSLVSPFIRPFDVLTDRRWDRTGSLVRYRSRLCTYERGVCFEAQIGIMSNQVSPDFD